MNTVWIVVIASYVSVGILGYVVFDLTETVNQKNEVIYSQQTEIQLIKTKLSNVEKSAQSGDSSPTRSAPTEQSVLRTSKTIESFPNGSVTLTEPFDGEEYTFHFQEKCLAMDAPENCGGYVKDIYGWQHQIFLVRQDSVEVMRAKCNHEMFHLVSPLEGDDEHRIIGADISDFPYWIRFKVCDRLMEELT